MFSASTSKKELLEFVAQFDVVAYARTRNHLSGQVSQLSPFITRGVITLPEIKQLVLSRYSQTVSEKFIQELSWRDYWQQVWFAKGDAIFTDLRFTRDDWQHEGLVKAITVGQTGITVIDEAILKLFATMLACNVGKANWYNMSRWLYYHLNDGDLASNMLSWQWVAGTNASKQYVANQAVINSCSDYKELRTFLTLPREEVGQGAVPDVLIPSVPFDYVMEYPESETFDSTAPSVFLYSPWTLNPDWRATEEGERVLLIEPSWFDEFPISPSVLEFIVTVARTQMPGIKVVVKNATDLPLSNNTKVYSQSYPTHEGWPGTVDPAPRLFPKVNGYYSSFFKFWEACERSR
jgi:deoxyribodipyrimidine photo-lyase